MKLALATIASVLASCAGACSAEITNTAADPVFSWTGPYIGVFGGGLKDAPKFGFQFTDVFMADAKGFDVGNSVGGVFGAQVGYDHQIGNFVFGAVADIAYSGHSTETDVIGANPGYLLLNSKLDYLGTVRGRVGYAMDRALLYGHGGFAFGKIEASYGYKLFPESRDFDKETVTGYVAGAGLEYAFTDHLSGQLEYSFVDFGDRDMKLSGQSTGFTDHAQFHMLKAGLNFRF